MAISYFGNSVLIIIKNGLAKLPPYMSCTRLLITSQLLYNIKNEYKYMKSDVYYA